MGGKSVPDLVSSYESQGFRDQRRHARECGRSSCGHFQNNRIANFERADRIAGQLRGILGILLSNAVDAEVNDTWISSAIDELTSSILGPTKMFGSIDARGGEHSSWRRLCAIYRRCGRHRGKRLGRTSLATLSDAAKPSFEIDLTSHRQPGKKIALLVVRPGESIQKAVDALPLTGGDITVSPEPIAKW